MNITLPAIEAMIRIERKTSLFFDAQSEIEFYTFESNCEHLFLEELTFFFLSYTTCPLFLLFFAYF